MERAKLHTTYVDGVAVIKVRAPLPGEEVQRYVDFSGFLIQPTITQKARQDAKNESRRKYDN